MATYVTNSDAVSPTVAEVNAAKVQDVSRLAGGAGVALGGRIAGRGVRLGLDIVLARLLGPASFGLYAIGWTITRMVTLFTPLGLDAGVIRYGAKYWQRDDAAFSEVVKKSVLFATLSGLLVGFVFYLAAGWVGVGIFHSAQMTSVMQMFALVFPLATIIRVAAAATRISQRMKYSVLAEDILQPSWDLVIVLVLAFAWSKSLLVAIFACLVSHGIAALVAGTYVKRLFPELSVKRGIKRPKLDVSGKELLAFSLPASLTGVFGVLIIWVDRLMIGYYRPAAEVGVYQAASQISVAFAIILGAMGAIFSPMTADFFHRGEMNRLEEIFRISTKWGLYLSLPPFLVTCFASREVMQVLFGKPYITGAAVLFILSLGQVVNAGTGPVGMLLVMAGYQNKMFMISGTMFAVSVGLGIALVPRWGMDGAAVATAIALSGLFIAAIILAQVKLKMRPYDRRYLKGAAATAVAGVLMFLFRNAGTSSALLRLILNSSIAFGAFGGVLLLTGLDAEDRQFIRHVRAKFSVS
jgi:O-antigen/teichoic acid export membrane protein